MIMHLLLSPRIDLVPEAGADALRRYTGFGRELFDCLFAEMPNLAGKFRFFRDPGTNDIWSICEDGSSAFGVQLDHDIEVICLWNSSGFDEIGTWFDDPISQAIERIRTEYLKSEEKF